MEKRDHSYTVGGNANWYSHYGEQYAVLLYLVAQSCPTLCHPMNYSPPGSSAHGIFQTRILEWVAMPFSRDLPNPGIESMSPALQTDSLLSEPPGKPKAVSVPWLFWIMLQWTQEIQMSRYCDFISFDYIASSGNVGSNGSSIFNFLRKIYSIKKYN